MQVALPRTHGYSAKAHRCNPLKLILTAAQAPEVLLAGYTLQSVIAERGYDSNQLLKTLHDKGITPVIPPRSLRRQPGPYDRWLYRERIGLNAFLTKSNITLGCFPVSRKQPPMT